MPLHSQVHPLLVLLLLVLSVSIPSDSASSSCPGGGDDAAIVAAAFRHVRNFQPQTVPACTPVQELRLPSRNLTGAVAWASLANLSALAALDLSGNALRGAIPGGFWRAPSLLSVDVSGNQLGGSLRVEPSPRLRSLNVSGNRFTGVAGLDGLAGLDALDLSANRIRAVPLGLRRLTRLSRLDLSRNAMQGRFPGDLPPLGGVRFLNVSYNNMTGAVNASAVKKFGASAFLHAGNASLVFSKDSAAPAPRRAPPPSPPPPPRGASTKKDPARKAKSTATEAKGNKHLGVVAVAVVCGVASVIVLLCLVGSVACGVVRCRRRKSGGKETEDKKAQPWGGEKEEEEVAVPAAAAKGASAATVVLFERPLMELTLADLAAATSGFGRESQLAERGGRSGAAYRAVLPGDLHVVVRVVEGGMAGVEEDDDDPAAAAAAFRELARFRHPNILPLLGYCIAGREKLLLYEYMEKGDLHRWLHELPAGRPDTDDDGGDIWETAAEEKRSISDWPTRHRIALGVARGLAFLHQGWAGSGRAVVHGHLVPANVLLGDDLEPRISDFGHLGGGEDATAEGDVYGFGVLVLELMTGQGRWDEASVSWARGIVRDGKALDIVDPRVHGEAAAGPEAEREMVECLRVGYLCTAQAPDKRPTMQQVVGVLKDIRPAARAPHGGDDA
ncbi:calmodulin-binding receptor kinase CaMRLK-like [Lolium rigidum]|uniref:calmodulin-binding receptor kinase CaMRLK-like n=1 Tax=Lolium rigidum TaxID=89674 RepID=UPI001F5D01C3|nr:calmodulin-binding receptor kinase CaMRLK-like [Lolium rigidum]